MMARNNKQQTIFGNYNNKLSNEGPVECLGIYFDNDDERREYFLNKLREKLKDPEFRNIEGFPIGSDEDILALSDPPYYTACPNPFIVEFIEYYGKPYDPKEPYNRKPFAADVSEGKNDPIYNAHTYHTKVPHKAIMRYILHYSDPGDVVFDGFCGTGMMGVAAKLCGDKASVELLGYKVEKDGTIIQQATDEKGNITWEPTSKLGLRRAVLRDLSPAATFIAYNYNMPIAVDRFEEEAKKILKSFDNKYGWFYKTLHNPSSTQVNEAIALLKNSDFNNIGNLNNINAGEINYVIWSELLRCTHCNEESTYWEVAVNQENRYKKKITEHIKCKQCGALELYQNWERVFETYIDPSLNRPRKRSKVMPVLINYSYGGKKYEKCLDDFDYSLLDKISKIPMPLNMPTLPLPEGQNTRQPLISSGASHVHHFYIHRSLLAYSYLDECVSLLAPPLINVLKYWLQSVGLGFTKLNRYLKASFSQVNRYLKGTLYVAPFISEVSPNYSLIGKIKRLKSVFFSCSQLPSFIVETKSTTGNGIPDSSVDYIFTDPPFGGNIMYSELNYLWESWLKVFTNNKQEAIESKSQGKGLTEYHGLMTLCFKEYFRVLKPGRWMTVEFHNSKNSVWNAIQESLQHAGFVVADVRTLDKKQMTMKQMTTASAVKQDLIISAYKPNSGLEERFKLEAGTENGVWDFVRTHLKQLPVFISKDGQIEVIVERQNYLLFDRMVAFHVQRGVTVPLSAAEFYQGLTQRFPERDGMYFLSEQVAEYDKKRMTVREVLQLQLIVTDESSAIQWLKQQLTKKPQTFQELHPQFIREIGGWQKHEKPLELSQLLEQNFLRYDGIEEVSSQIHSYLSTNFKDLRKLTKDDPVLITKAKNRWYVPDPNKAGDLEKLRERSLLKEFEEYRATKQKRLKVFRLEAVRAGFKKAWQERDYITIIEVADKVPEKVLQEDPKLLMWYDQALTRRGEDNLYDG